jgi:CRISPR-associated endonuclease Cas1
MATRTLTSTDRIPLHDGVLVLSGYGLRLAMERGHLLVEDGIADERWTARLSRLDRDLKRVVIIGHAGTITLDAVRWLHGVRVPLVHLDADGDLFFVSAPSAAMVSQLRRAQALAASTPWGLALARELLEAKIRGQLSVLQRLNAPEETIAFVADCRRALGLVKSLPDLRWVEADAARAYWNSWTHVPVRFAVKDASRRPSHWRSFGSRNSPLTKNQRKAVNPANAVLNYLYALLEAETRIAALAVGLDPMVGLLHSDTPARDSLAFDLMEPLRPAVDNYLLDLLERRTFVKEDFFEKLDGHCRLMPPLSKELASSLSQWARLVLPVAQKVGSMLKGAYAQAEAGNGVKASFNKVNGRRGKPRPQRIASREFGAPVDSSAALPGRTCPGCGGPIAATSRRCRTCERAAVHVPRIASLGPGGRQANPRQLPASLQRRREAMLAVKAANDAWEASNQPVHDVAWFRQNVLPGLQRFSLVTLQSVTGLSHGACSVIRRGRVVPHPRHWAALQRLTRGR